MQYIRKNGPYTLVMSAVGENGRLPYGNLPRLLLAWVSTEAVRTQRRELILGRSLSEFMRKLGPGERRRRGLGSPYEAAEPDGTTLPICGFDHLQG